MKVLSQTFAIRTERGPQFVDITEQVTDAMRQAGLLCDILELAISQITV